VRGRRRIAEAEDSTRAAVADIVNEKLATASTIAPNSNEAKGVAAPAKRRGRPPGSVNKAPATAAPKPPPKTESERTVTAAKERSNKRDTPNAPDFSEWSDFLGEVVLHWFSVAFVAVALRGVPYHEIFTQEDYEDIQLDDDELKSIARPFAHLITHSSINTKYGRAIMNSRDSIEAFVVLFMWMSRVNRIGKKYKRMMTEVTQDVPRIPRPDRARDSNDEIEGEAIAPIPGIAHAAFGHGFN
jgi:hypothetical protein